MVTPGLFDVFESAPTGMCLMTMAGRILRANETLAHTLGYADAAALEATVRDVGRELLDAPEKFASFLGKLYSSEQAHMEEVRISHATGRECWMCLNARLLRPEVALQEFPDREEQGTIGADEPVALCVFTDITGRVLQNARQLEENQGYKTLYENTAEPLFLCDADGKLLLGNNALARLFGYDTFDKFCESRHFLPELFDDPTQFSVLQKELDMDAEPMRFEVLVVQRGGGKVWVRINANLAHDHLGQTALIHGAMHDISEQKNLEARLLREGYRDVLTGLANRAMFLNLLDKSIARAKRRNNNNFALVVVSMDSFSMIKQSLGHGIAEEALTKVASILVDSLRTEDICARLGVSEFGLLLSDVSMPADAVRVIDRIGMRLRSPLNIQGKEVFAQASSGIVLSDMRYQSSEAMLDDADTALHRAKADSVQSFAVFKEEMQQQATARLRVETDLRLALEKGEFTLYFQPIVSLSSGSIDSFEALLRWERPNIGIVPPDHFIYLLEETGLILPAGQWVLEQACKVVRNWQQAFPSHRDMSVSVNISPRQLEHDSLPDVVKGALQETGLNPECLKLEITETMFIKKPEEALEKLSLLKDFGVGISIDDFGTGYSSLAYLHRIPADILKIDKTFIHSMRLNHDGETIVRAIVTLAHSLGKRVVAEGVETSQQLSSLMQLQCEYVQGYYFAKPLPQADAGNLIVRGFDP